MGPNHFQFNEEPHDRKTQAMDQGNYSDVCSDDMIVDMVGDSSGCDGWGVLTFEGQPLLVGHVFFSPGTSGELKMLEPRDILRMLFVLSTLLL